ncbi:hypothetical protein E0E50_05870 [Azotobacter chroococcum subsp. isscasi]|uniref:hypothetical protein n=1 Tax=Azotobacter chroococcum TaxID=353 RepID=UPI00103D87BB|nr:hypothetical protein [Azotobacter chroococcum]TBW11697.1 hypothetical protein E0E50_05870 [Azotobacter chroococcum subsp. isscasi]
MSKQAHVNTGKSGISNTRKSGHLGIGIAALVAPTSTASMGAGVLPFEMEKPRTMPTLTPGVARASRRRYSAPATVNPVAGFGDPKTTRRTSAPMTIAGAFLVSAMPCYGGCAWETERSAGFRVSRFANLRTAATNDRLATAGDSSNQHTEHHP